MFSTSSLNEMKKLSIDPIISLSQSLTGMPNEKTVATTVCSNDVHR